MSSDGISSANENDAIEAPRTVPEAGPPMQPPADDVPTKAVGDAAARADAASENRLVTTKAPVLKTDLTKSLREWGLVVIIAVAAAVLMKVFVVQQFKVSGESMDYTLHNNDRVLVNKLSYDLHDPNRGDVVVLEQSNGVARRDLIKRVIGLPGETIEMRDCIVYINDNVLVEPYLDPEVVTQGNCGMNFSKVTVEKEHVFVMGDNRPGSGDSRAALGQVDYDQIVGRAFVVMWPKGHWEWL